MQGGSRFSCQVPPPLILARYDSRMKKWTAESRAAFLRQNALKIYDSLTARRKRYVRVDELCALAAKKYPGLVPDAKTLAREAPRAQKDKAGAERDQGLFLSHILADPAAGTHLCHAMLLPRADSLKLQAEF